MIGARIKCDNCQFIGEMDFSKMCKTTAKAPEGWATVYPMIRIKGERNLDRNEREALKQKIADKTPAFHICPRCVFGEWEVKLDRLLGHGGTP